MRNDYSLVIDKSHIENVLIQGFSPIKKKRRSFTSVKSSDIHFISI